jgi:thioredoxin-like negative regulator of GroEL
MINFLYCAIKKNKRAKPTNTQKKQFLCKKTFNLKTSSLMAVHDATDANFQDALQNHDKVVVKFFAGWCGSCRLFKPKFKSLSEEDNYQGIHFLDVNAEENPEARKAAGVNNLPFFAIFQNGKMLEGASTNKEENVRAMLEKLA